MEQLVVLVGKQQTCFEPCQEVTAEIDTNSQINSGGSIEVEENEIIEFTAIGSFSNSISDNAIYEWNLGDGTTQFGENIQHSFSSAGLYNVTLVITDYNNCDSNIAEIQVIIGASIPGNPYVSAGDDITLDCENLASLSAEYLDIGETTEYIIESIPFVPPFPFSDLANSINIDTDDIWDDVEDFPTDDNGNQFDFCFFDEFIPQFQVGSNGNINFYPPSNTTNGWNLNGAQIPNNSVNPLFDSSVLAPFHDIRPGINSQTEISWEIIGNFPNRVLAVSYYNVPMFGCNSGESTPTEDMATHMAVFYETTNIIDIYIKNAPYCSSFNNNKIVGIQNNQGTIAYVPPDRNNTGTWSTQEEAWRFTPAGESIVEFEWLDSDGNFISNDKEIDVNVYDTTNFTAKVTYTTCTGNITIVEDDIMVTIEEPPFNFQSVVELDNNGTTEIIEGENLDFCADVLPVIINSQYESASAVYQWYLDGQLISSNNSSIVVDSPQSGEYVVEVLDGG